VSEPLYDKVTITSIDSTASRVLLGSPVGGLNQGIRTPQQGLLVPSIIPTTLPQLTAVVSYRGEVLNPQPPVLREVSCGSHVAVISQDGVITRRSSATDQSFDSNGTVSTGQIGSLIQVSATVLRGDGSQSGVRGTIDVTIQNSAARQFAPAPLSPFAAASNAPSAKGFFNLVDPPEGVY
jgi:hypothetical protein